MARDPQVDNMTVCSDMDQNNSDRYIRYNGDPDVTFGFASNFNYKNFDFSFHKI